MVILYHGFRNLTSILESNKLQAPKLQSINFSPHLFVDPILISLIGDSELVKTQKFNLVEKYEQNHKAINKKLNELFGARAVFDFSAFKNAVSHFKMVDTKEFYDSNVIYFSKQPENTYFSYLSIEVSNVLIRNSPQNSPIIPGEIVLDDSVKFYTKDPYITRPLLQKYGKDSSLLF